jgi:D-inositol-3-phosphate glycosyltransferase
MGGEGVPLQSIEELTLFHPAGRFVLPDNPFGKDVANGALFRALARHGGYRQLHVLNQLGLSSAQLAEGLFAEGEAGPALSGGPLWSTAIPALSGVLLRGQPHLSELAWIRRGAGRDDAYSLVGLIHTLAPPAVRESIGAAAVAPLQSWDALVCTSPAVQQALHAMFDDWGSYLRERFGGSRLALPQLPLIPLAVEVETIAGQAASTSARAALRSRLGIAADDLLVLWLGRLSYFEKAFPQVMFQAVQEAARQAGVRVHLALVGWFPNGEADQQLYRQAAEAYASDVNVLVLDGNDQATVAQSWAAADIFLSLVDNIQETFGLAPVEAMAAGLPVVVSDWDGYRYTVRDGVEGFLIPTLGAPGGAPGQLLAHLHSLGLETYQTYAGAVAQHTAVHGGQAAAALARLIASPELRASMGAAGQRRARQMFSWPVVVEQYNALFAELAERRLAAQAQSGATSPHRISPLRGDPFVDFSGFATTVLEPDTRVRLGPGVAGPEALARIQAVALDRMYPGLRGSPEETARLLALVAATDPVRGCSVAELSAGFAPTRLPFLATTLVWLAKLGLLDWLPPG